ncbi:MAG: hypothetical protein MUD10_01450 [Candidatus Pacebacteria bacterium]|nr:hypothetical protein [Candidatus Paceibacterota bacterium]
MKKILLFSIVIFLIAIGIALFLNLNRGNSPIVTPGSETIPSATDPENKPTTTVETARASDPLPQGACETCPDGTPCRKLNGAQQGCQCIFTNGKRTCGLRACSKEGESDRNEDRLVCCPGLHQVTESQCDEGGACSGWLIVCRKNEPNPQAN